MKRIVLTLILMAAAFFGGAYWRSHHAEAPAKPVEEKAADEEKGHGLVKMEATMQAKVGITTEKPAAMTMNHEVMGYGRVLDPALLAGLLTDLAASQAAYVGTSKELERVKILSTQGNSSERIVQAAEAAATRDQIAVQAAKDKIRLSWGVELAEKKDVMESLLTRKSVLVRIDLSAGESSNTPIGARIFDLAGNSAEGELLGLAPNVDAQTLGHGFIFIVRSANYVPGDPVTGYLKIAGEPQEGVKILSQSVIRTDGAGWVYLVSGADQFTRAKVALDRPLEAGWFITTGVTTNDSVVTSGAQILLSEEQKASLKAD